MTLVTVLVVTTGAWVVAEEGAPRNESGRWRGWSRADPPRVETFTLDNGMQVIAIPLSGSAYVTYTVWYKVGSADDPVGKSGLAHLVEHATVRGVGEHTEYATSRLVGQNDAEAGAFSSYDYTAYYSVVPLDRLEAVMQTEAKRMANLVLTNDILIPERHELSEERRDKVTKVPEVRFDEQLRAVSYGTHPYGVPVLGWPDEAQKLTVQDVNQFYRRWYAPNNAILIVAGDLPMARLKPLVQTYYGSIPARPIPVRQRPAVPDRPTQRRFDVKDPHARQPLWKRVYRAPSYHAGDTSQTYALQVFAEILAAEPTGRLFRSLILKKRLALTLGVDYLSDSVGMTDFSLYAIPAPGVGMATLEREIDRELDAVLATGVSSTELMQAQRHLQRETAFASELSGEIVDTLGVALTTGRTLVDVMQWRERIAAVTREQVRAATQTVLRAERSVTGRLLPVSVGDTAGN